MHMYFIALIGLCLFEGEKLQKALHFFSNIISTLMCCGKRNTHKHRAMHGDSHMVIDMGKL